MKTSGTTNAPKFNTLGRFYFYDVHLFGTLGERSTFLGAVGGQRVWRYLRSPFYNI